jgi:hypothetical protein
LLVKRVSPIGMLLAVGCIAITAAKNLGKKSDSTIHTGVVIYSSYIHSTFITAIYGI